MIDWEQARKEGLGALLLGIVGQDSSEVEAKALLSELKSLCETLGLVVTESMSVKIRARSASILMGTGKADEIVATAKAINVGIIIFDDELSPTQQRNWEKLSGLRVIDRRELILQIFAQRATTKEARLQVEQARLKFALPRLAHSYADLGSQRGGRYGTKGTGETQLELDKREIKFRINQIRKELDDLLKLRATQRKRREKTTIPRAAIVGYTNAGKSTLLNAMTGANVLAEDKLFATLDPTTRRLQTAGGRSLLVTDTVGFVRKLPHDLVEAFKSTLEETLLADILVNVLDSSDPQAFEQYRTTRAVLSELGAGEKPEILVLSKADKEAESDIRESLKLEFPNAILCSSRSGEGLEELALKIGELISAEDDLGSYLVPLSRQDLIAMAHRTGVVKSIEYRGEFAAIKAKLPSRSAALFEPYRESESTQD